MASISLTQLQKLAQPQQLKTTTGLWMQNPHYQLLANQEADNDSWEVRAFEEDTNNAMGTTWPPRSYTCTFCRREFKSAQALGGHMNVHRHDRAQLHHMPPLGFTNPTTSASTLITDPTHHQQELLEKNGLCLLYSLPNPSRFFSPTTINDFMEIESPYTTNNLMLPKYCSPSINFPVPPHHSINSSLCQPNNTEYCASTVINNIDEDSMEEELDLELRLGRRCT